MWLKFRDNRKTNSKQRNSQNSIEYKKTTAPRKPKSDKERISKPKDLTETELPSEKENVAKTEAKPKKLSRPKKEKEVEIKKEIIEEKKPIERAANDPRNK